MAVGVRERVRQIPDSLPRNEVFDWVDLVSIESALQMLATLFDFPFEEWRRLTLWSDLRSGCHAAEVQRKAPRPDGAWSGKAAH